MQPGGTASGWAGMPVPPAAPGRFARPLALAALALSGGLAACGPTPGRDPFSASGRLIALSGADAGPQFACFSCHGLDGSGSAAAPRLAGLPPGYLLKQLEDYADGRRSHAPMSAIASALGPRDRREVAFYYASLPPRWRRQAAPGATAAVERLYHRGDPRRGLAPCASCHGIRGEGIGAANPPLAGQPAAYLEAQLQLWQVGKRRNDPRDLMLHISRRLRPDEAAGLAAYAARLPGSTAPAARAPAPFP